LQQQTSKEIGLRLATSGKNGKVVEATVLEDIRVNADARANALVISAPAETIDLILAIVKELDVASNIRMTTIPLKKASAARVASALTTFYNTRYPPPTINLVKFTWDDGSNSVIVQAPPTDLEEIRGLIEYFDNNRGP